jgi:hypothetical protein
MQAGNRRPINPLVRTPIAQQAEKMHACSRLGCSCCSVSQKAYMASVSHRQTMASGRLMRVKMKMPKLESRISAAYRPARALRNARLANASTTKASARIVSEFGMRAAAVETPKTLKLVAIDQYSSGAFSR